jgi:hypothetical protein
MKTIHLYLLAFLVFSVKGFCAEPSLEAKLGYFFFADSKMRKVYDEGGVDLQLSGSYPVWKWLHLYGSVEYLQRSGHSLSDHQKTDIWQIPVTVGLKGCVTICSWASYYLTAGPRYFYVHVHNDSSYVDRNLDENGIGGFLGTGFSFFPYRHFLVDLFGEYSYERVHLNTSKRNVETKSMQIGGFVVGIGLGYGF